MPKVLLVFVPAFLLLTLLSTALLLEYGRAQARDALAARIGALTGRVALALGVVTRGPAQPDPKLLRSLLAAFSGEAAFLCAEVTRPDGTRLAAWPAIGCDALDQPSTETWLMVPTDHGVPPLALRLRYTDDPLREDIARLGLLLALGGTASFAIALLALWLAHRLWLGPPIKRLLASIRAGAEAGVRRPVQWTSGDEMGRIVAAYNGLLAREDSREAALVDINERLETRVRRRTLELQSSEARLRAIIDMSADGIVTTDARGTILSVNGAAMEMFAQAASILVGQNLTMLFGSGGEIGALLAAPPTANADQRRSENLRIAGRRADGTEFPLDVHVAAIAEPDGTLFTLFLRDITTQTHFEDGLRRAKDAAERTDRAKSEFLAVVTHELRTPLNGVIGMTGLLLDGKLDEQSRHYAETLREAGEHLLQLINDVLDYTKLEANRLAFEEIQFEPETVLSSTVELLMVKARAKGLALGTWVASGVPARVHGDPGRLRQVLMNLVGNAIKFTDEGGVRVTLAAEPIVSDGTSTHLMLRFEVRDTGIGIAAEHMDSLFHEFTQVDSSISRRFGGTGLGLAICRRLVLGMGGEIEAMSEPGAGSVFRFTARVRQVADGEMITPPDAPARPLVRTAPDRSLRVLVAEDNATNQIVIAAMLNKLGHRADLVANGLEAVDAVQQRPYALVLMDVMMPEMDGLDATRRIRALPEPLCRIPIFGLTAHVTGAEHTACRDAGMNRVITKPLTIKALAGPIAELDDSARAI